MINEIPPLDETPPCGCGARMSEGAGTCRKCAAVLRWRRRQAKRGNRRAPSTRPAGRPHRPRRNGPGSAAVAVAASLVGLVFSVPLLTPPVEVKGL
jgi:hypothetical protein